MRSTCVLPVAVVKGRFCLPLPDIGRFVDEWLDLNSAYQNRFNSWRQQYYTSYTPLPSLAISTFGKQRPASTTTIGTGQQPSTQQATTTNNQPLHAAQSSAQAKSFSLQYSDLCSFFNRVCAIFFLITKYHFF